MLADAYRQGLEEGLVKLRQVAEVVELALEHLDAPQQTREQLKRSMGL